MEVKHTPTPRLLTAAERMQREREFLTRHHGSITVCPDDDEKRRVHLAKVRRAMVGLPDDLDAQPARTEAATIAALDPDPLKGYMRRAMQREDEVDQAFGVVDLVVKVMGGTR